MKVSIITEGFLNTGYGHITRCLSLYQAFEEKRIYPVLYVNGDENSKAFLNNLDFKIFDWLHHPADLVKEISYSDILIIDSYIAGKEFYEKASQSCGISLFIDDTMRLEYPKGTILNGTLNAETFPYKKNSIHDYLLGSKYIPLRKEYGFFPGRKINKDVQSILITFGGQDPKKLTKPVLNAVREMFPGFILTVVIGNGFADIDSFRSVENERTKFIFSPDSKKMNELMLSCDIAISAAGQTLYELAATGTPAISIAVAENQKPNIYEWKKNKFLIDPIFSTDINYLRKVTGQINSLLSITQRKKAGSIGRAFVDGRGAQRVVEHLIDKHCLVNYFYLRKAVLDDSKNILALSNEPSVRTQSITKTQIGFDEHNKWFSKKISEEDYIFLLAFDKKNNFIGQVRFQIQNNSAVVSISIRNEFRGKGLSKKILKEACIKTFRQKNIEKIIAYILPNNIASTKAFTSIGFVPDGEEILGDETFYKFVLSK
jgi:spore coat polysaccharide biosynthesis predicted glycosyltransferase SpsG/RimJ/RimL family protein N-acetyltransferase